MAAEAAEKACIQAGISPKEVELILVATSTPECCFPSTACQVQGEIGAEGAAAFDISAACSGFIFAPAHGKQLSGIRDIQDGAGYRRGRAEQAGGLERSENMRSLWRRSRSRGGSGRG